MCANLINWAMQISFSFSYYFCLLTGFFSYHNHGFSSFLQSCQFLLFPDNTEVLLQIHSSSRLLKLLAEVFFNLYETFLFVPFNSFGEVVGGWGALWSRNGSGRCDWNLMQQFRGGATELPGIFFYPLNWLVNLYFKCNCWKQGIIWLLDAWTCGFFPFTLPFVVYSLLFCPAVGVISILTVIASSISFACSLIPKHILAPFSDLLFVLFSRISFTLIFYQLTDLK